MTNDNSKDSHNLSIDNELKITDAPNTDSATSAKKRNNKFYANTRRTRRANRKKIISLKLIFCAAISALLIFSIHTTHKTTTLTNQNTLSIQNEIDDLIHLIDLFEISKNENYLVALQSELNRLDILFLQTSKIHESYNIFSSKSETSKLHQLVQTNKFYLEESMKKTIQFNPTDLYNMRSEYIFLEKEITKKPISNYSTFIHQTNAWQKEFRSHW